MSDQPLSVGTMLSKFDFKPPQITKAVTHINVCIHIDSMAASVTEIAKTGARGCV